MPLLIQKAGKDAKISAADAIKVNISLQLDRRGEGATERVTEIELLDCYNISQKENMIKK